MGCSPPVNPLPHEPMAEVKPPLSGRTFPWFNSAMGKWSLVVTLGLLAGLVLGECGTAFAQAQPTLIGIFEDNPAHYAGDPHHRDVRVVFRNDRTHWMAFPSNCPNQKCLKSIAAQFPHRVDWTVTFQGREIGHVLSQTPLHFGFYATVGQQRVVGTTEPPTVGKPAAKFAGYIGEPVYRPLVAVPQSH